MTRGRVGGLRHRISFEKQIRVADGAGGWTESWVAERTAWAKVAPVSGAERLRAMRHEHPVSHRITLRYDATTAAYHRDGEARRRIDFQGRKMHIVAIVNRQERNRWLEILAVEGTAA